MPVRVKKRHPALKHGGYAATPILPGESAAEFEKLHRGLIAKLTPNGALEDDIVATVARLLWRKQKFLASRTAEIAESSIESGEVAERRLEQLMESMIPSRFRQDLDPAEREEAIQATRKTLRRTFESVEIGETATVDCLMNDLAVQDRLDAIVDRCLKRLLFLRGLKSI